MSNEPPSGKTTATKFTNAARSARGLVKNIYLRAHEAKAKGQKVAYTMTGSQYDELLLAMNVVPIPTENYSGVCAAKRVAERFLVKAEDEGYSHDICGYVRTGLGFDGLRYSGQSLDGAPDGGMPEPDFLLGSSAFCDPRYKWYQALGRYKDLPVFAHDIVSPPVDSDLDTVKDYYIPYQVQQFRELISFIEKQTGSKLDLDNFAETLARSDEAWRVWWQCDELRKAIPCPMPSEDHYSAMVPCTFMSGSQEAVDFYQSLRVELEERVRNGIGTILDENFRLMVAGGLPPWHTMWIFNYFESLGAVSVIENAYRVNDPVIIPSHVSDPIEQLAWRTFLRFTQRYDQAKRRSGNPTVEKLLEMIDAYRIDGIIFYATKSCRASTIGQRYLKDVLDKYTSVPALHLIGDIVDMRDYSEDQWKNQINAFIEVVDTHKYRGN